MLTKEQREIIELFAKTMLIENFPPLAGKILGLLYVSDQKYFTFQELTENLKVTKGSVSKALKFLEREKLIDHVFKDVKRRRYFYANVQGSKDRFHKSVKVYENQIAIVNKMIEMRGVENPELTEYLKEYNKFNNGLLNYVVKIVGDPFK